MYTRRQNREFAPIHKRRRVDGIEGWVYEMPSRVGFNAVTVLVEAETGGHGCLFSIELPSHVSIQGACWRGPIDYVEEHELMHVLNRIFNDYNSSLRVVDGFQKTQEV